jgi:hypothetical protein
MFENTPHPATAGVYILPSPREDAYELQETVADSVDQYDFYMFLVIEDGILAFQAKFLPAFELLQMGLSKPTSKYSCVIY